MSEIVRLLAIAVLLAAVTSGCSDDDDGSESAATTTTTLQRGANAAACDFRPGDRIALGDLEAPCVKTLDCADGRIYIEAALGDGATDLEGFAPTDQSGNPRANGSDAVWQERGPLYEDTGRTKLSFDCGG